MQEGSSGAPVWSSEAFSEDASQKLGDLKAKGKSLGMGRMGLAAMCKEGSKWDGTSSVHKEP